MWFTIERRRWVIAATLVAVILCSLSSFVLLETVIDALWQRTPPVASASAAAGLRQLGVWLQGASILIAALAGAAAWLALAARWPEAGRRGGADALPVSSVPVASVPAAPVPLAPDAADADLPSARDLMAAMNALGSDMRRLVGDANHEMRTPIAIIAGSMAAVRRALPRENRRALRSAELIDRSCEKLVAALNGQREATARLVDSYLGVYTPIDVGAFLQDFIAQGGLGGKVALTHPPRPLLVRTHVDGFKEVLQLFLLAAPLRSTGAMTVRVTILEKRSWIAVVVDYEVPEKPVSQTSALALPAVEWAFGEARPRLGMMGASLRFRVEAGHKLAVQLMLPAETAT